MMLAIEVNESELSGSGISIRRIHIARERGPKINHRTLRSCRKLFSA